MMRTRVKTYIFLLLILFNLGLVLISPSVKAEEYQLGFADKTRLTLIYEYTEVDEDLLEYLADESGDETYEDFAEINEGKKIKMVISKIEEQDKHWSIEIESYSGKSLDRRGKNLNTKVYKKPEGLVDKIFESDTEALSLYFVPIDTQKYLEEFEDIAVEEDEYLEKEYELKVNKSMIIFDYILFGYSDMVIQEYGEDGILTLFKVLCYAESAFKMELIDSYEDYSIVVYTISFVITLIISILSISYFLAIKKNKKESLDSKILVYKMLNDIK